MNEQYFNLQPLIKYQKIVWKAIFLYFLATIVTYFFDSSLAEKLTVGGLIGILIITLLKIVLFIQQFQKAKLFRFALLSYLLIVLLLSTIALRYWIL